LVCGGAGIAVVLAFSEDLLLAVPLGRAVLTFPFEIGTRGTAVFGLVLPLLAFLTFARVEICKSLSATEPVLRPEDAPAAA
jgi:hypothetical protein